MRITLNLATRPFADLGPANKRLRIAMAVLAVLGIGLGLGLRALHQKAEQARDRDHSLDGQIARITQERQQYQDLMRQPANAEVLRQAGILNQLFDKKAFSWTLAMEDLETVLPRGVQVSTLEPLRDDKTGIITLHLRVIGPRDRAVEMVRNLEHSKRFLMPRIVGENSESAAAGPNNMKMEPVSASNRFNFDLLAEYNLAAPGEHKVQAKQEDEKKSADSERKSQVAQLPQAASPHPVPSAPGGPPGRPPHAAQPQPSSSRLNPQPTRNASHSLNPANATHGGPQ